MSIQSQITASTFVPITNKPAPLRVTQPQSHWRELLGSMRVGHWFLVKKKDCARVNTAANKYTRGRYSLYKHPSIKDTHVYVITK